MLGHTPFVDLMLIILCVHSLQMGCSQTRQTIERGDSPFPTLSKLYQLKKRYHSATIPGGLLQLQRVRGTGTTGREMG